ncbi:hypothetical protein QQP08_005795 [Theobroma cacao]|nr:hypothetical protein QQP08_005795 [Theobroma cacao]
MMESHLDENPEMRASMIGTGELSQRRGRIPGSEYAASSALMACIGELICKGKKGRVTWQWRDRVPRFSGKPFDNPWEIIGFACACLQCVVTAINYSFVSRHVDGPIKTSALPILFAFERMAIN